MLLRPHILSMASTKQRNWKAIELVPLAFSGSFHMSSFGSLRRGEGYKHTHTHTQTYTRSTHTRTHACTRTHTHTHTHKTNTHIYTKFMDKSNFKKPGLCQAGSGVDLDF